MITIVIIIVIIVGFIYWQNKPIKNSHKIPQIIELVEFDNPENNPEFEGVKKGHKIILSREMGYPGYNLFLTIKTNGKDLSELKKIIISWSEWTERIFNFYYSPTDENVSIHKDEIKIDLGSFNNCAGSTNFIKRTAASKIMKVDLLNYEPEHNDFEYEKNYETQSVFCPILTSKYLNQFKKGVHYIDS